MTPTAGSRRTSPATGGFRSSRRRRRARATTSPSRGRPGRGHRAGRPRRRPAQVGHRPRSPGTCNGTDPTTGQTPKAHASAAGVGDDLARGARCHRRTDRRRAALDAAAALAGRGLEACGGTRGDHRGRPAISRDPSGFCVAACPGSTPGSSGARRARDRDRARRVQRIRRHAVGASAGAADLATSAPPGYGAAEAISRLSRSWATSAPGR